MCKTFFQFFIAIFLTCVAVDGLARVNAFVVNQTLTGGK